MSEAKEPRFIPSKLPLDLRPRTGIVYGVIDTAVPLNRYEGDPIGTPLTYCMTIDIAEFIARALNRFDREN